MRKFFFAAVFAAAACPVSGQEVKLLEDLPAETEKTKSVQPGDEMQIIMPSEEKPAAEAKPAAEEKKAEQPAKPKTAPKKKTAKKTPAAVKPAAAAVAKPAALPAAVAVKPEEKPAVQVPAEVKPAAEKKAEPAPAAPVQAKPAPAASAKPAAAKPVEKAAAKPAAAAAPAAPAVTAVVASPQKPEEKKAPAAAPKTQPAAKPAPVPAKEEPKPQAAAPSGGFAVTKKHTVSGGDTLWDLSNKYYKDPYKWGRIYNANLGTVSNPDRIYPKNELLIPDITEEVVPEKRQPVVIGEGDTVKDADLVSADVAQPAETAAAEPEEPAYSAPKAVPPPAAELQEALAAYDRNDLSEKMPDHQKEWSSGVRIVPDDWREDGVIVSKEAGDDDSMEDSLSLSGAMVRISMSGSAVARPGDYMTVYLKGSEALDKDGKRLGREIQRAGTLQVVSADGGDVKARVVDAVTGIYKGYIVKKK